MFANETRFDSIIAQAAAKWSARYGVAVPVALVKAVVANESSFRYPTPTRTEPDGRVSRGLMQVLEATARDLGLTNVKLLDVPAVGIDYGVNYLARQLRTFGGNVAKALAAYNGGPGNVQRGTVSQRAQQYARTAQQLAAYFTRQAAPAIGGLLLAAAVVWAIVAASRRRPRRAAA